MSKLNDPKRPNDAIEPTICAIMQEWYLDRWVYSQQGHFQIVLSNEHCPLFQKDLSWFQRLMYCSGVWSYVVGAITAPMFIAIPLVTIWAGVFPIVVSWWAAGLLPPNSSPLPLPSAEGKKQWKEEC